MKSYKEEIGHVRVYSIYSMENTDRLLHQIQDFLKAYTRRGRFIAQSTPESQNDSQVK